MRKRSRTEAEWRGNILLFFNSFVAIGYFSLAILCVTIFSPPPSPSTSTSYFLIFLPLLPRGSFFSASIFTLPTRSVWHQYELYHQSSLFITVYHNTSCILHLSNLFFVSFYSIEFYQLVMSSIQRLINNFHPYRSIFSSTNRSVIFSINLFFSFHNFLLSSFPLSFTSFYLSTSYPLCTCPLSLALWTSSSTPPSPPISHPIISYPITSHSITSHSILLRAIHQSHHITSHLLPCHHIKCRRKGKNGISLHTIQCSTVRAMQYSVL